MVMQSKRVYKILAQSVQDICFKIYLQESPSHYAWRHALKPVKQLQRQNIGHLRVTHDATKGDQS